MDYLRKCNLKFNYKYCHENKLKKYKANIYKHILYM